MAIDAALHGEKEQEGKELVRASQHTSMPIIGRHLPSENTACEQIQVAPDPVDP